MSSAKARILLFIDWFEPAYKAGGPIRSAVNFVQHMKADYEIFVLTSDRDLNQQTSLPGIRINEWSDYDGGVKVMYLSPDKQGMASIKSLILSVQPAFIYLNSVFSKSFAIYPMLIARNKAIQARLVMSPRGMLRSSALQFKAFKKKIFLSVFKIAGIPERLRFIATEEQEAADVKKLFPKAEIFVASNFGTALPLYKGAMAKQAGDLSIIFVGRIHPIKNLDVLLKSLATVKGTVRLTIVGVLENEEYWNSCKQIIASFNKNIEVDYKGDLPYHELARLTDNHHIFALPTKGENFGHAIFEALCLGKPVVISDQTPWRNLAAQKAGWDISLSELNSFSAAIQKAVDWTQEEYRIWSEGAWQKAKTASDNTTLKEQYKKIFS